MKKTVLYHRLIDISVSMIVWTFTSLMSTALLYGAHLLVVHVGTLNIYIAIMIFGLFFFIGFHFHSSKSKKRKFIRTKVTSKKEA